MEHVADDFVWDIRKELANIRKHGLDFSAATEAFSDLQRKIYVDSKHSEEEPRYFCIGAVGGRIITVRFVYRDGKIRIFGAGCWRKGVSLYESEEKK
jgi:hypothetical protein